MTPTNTQPKSTPLRDSAESRLLGIYDRLADHRNCAAFVVIGPAKEDGSPDWENAYPATLESLPDDLWPDDPKMAARAAVLVDDIDGCDSDTSMLIFLSEGLQASVEQIAGPKVDAAIATAIIARDIGADAPPPPPPSALVESMEKLTASLTKPVAANDNVSPKTAGFVIEKRLERLQKVYGGKLVGDVLTGATINRMQGKVTIDDIGAVFTSVRGEFLVPEDKPVVATPFSLGDATALPERDWLYARHYIRRYATASVGPGGGGKTAHSISEVLAMVTGRPLLDPNAGKSKPLRVWWINAEDPQDEIDRRFHAAAKHFNIGNDQIDGRLFTDSGRDQEFVIARQEGKDLRLVEPFIEDMVAEIRRRQIDVVIIDPFVSTHEAQENDNGAMQRVTAAWVRVADESNCGIELVHHVAKNQGEVTADSARGGGAFKDKVRSMRVFNVMTPAEAEKAGVDNARAYFRVDLGKVNMVASGQSQWRRFVSVPLMNGKGLIKTGDEIGVVESWSWPSRDDLAERQAAARAAVVSDVPAELLAGFKVRLGASDYKASEQATNWAGHLVAELFGMNVKANKAKIKEMLAAWIAAGELEIVDILDAYRHPKPHIKPAAAP